MADVEMETATVNTDAIVKKEEPPTEESAPITTEAEVKLENGTNGNGTTTTEEHMDDTNNGQATTEEKPAVVGFRYRKYCLSFVGQFLGTFGR